MVKVTSLTPTVKKNILAKARSGDYYVRLTDWNTKSGQHFVIFPTNIGLDKGIKFKPEYVNVRFPEIPRPDKKNNVFDKKGGYAYSEKKVLKMSDTVSKILEN